ncbi:MAG: hypothetical protein ACXABY_33325 [Candidatus Thorarchaeota archaeon]|jgi:hypothetical protein
MSKAHIDGKWMTEYTVFRKAVDAADQWILPSEGIRHVQRLPDYTFVIVAHMETKPCDLCDEAMSETYLWEEGTKYCISGPHKYRKDIYETKNKKAQDQKDKENEQ